MRFRKSWDWREANTSPSDRPHRQRSQPNSKERELQIFARGETRLAHGWRLSASGDLGKVLIGSFIRPAVRAVPSEMARRIGTCRFSLVAGIHDADLSSQWTDTGQEVEILVAAGDRDAHDIAMELLVCLGQILWERLTPDESKAYWELLDAEFQAGIEGEIDDEAFTQKKTLLRNRVTARSRITLERYTRTSFSETAAEYVHSLWHDVSVVTGPEHLPAPQLRRRLELFSLWFRPNRGYRLVARSRFR